jgi:hypothetical protein
MPSEHDKNRGAALAKSEHRENPAVARIYYELSNMERHDICWEWMEACDHGEYLRRDDVIGLIERYLEVTNANELHR